MANRRNSLCKQAGRLLLLGHSFGGSKCQRDGMFVGDETVKVACHATESALPKNNGLERHHPQTFCDVLSAVSDQSH